MGLFKSGHSWTSCLETEQLLSQSWQEFICQSVTAQVPQCFAPSTTNWSICKNVTNYILLIRRFHGDLACKTWIIFCISIRDRWLNRWPTILLRDCLCRITDGPQPCYWLYISVNIFWKLSKVWTLSWNWNCTHGKPQPLWGNKYSMRERINGLSQKIQFRVQRFL